MRTTLIATTAIVLAVATTARADDTPMFESGRLLATGGVSNVEGAGGGGISTWALISGYGTKDAIGANVHLTYAGLSNFQVATTGVSVGIYNRVELSYSHLTFETGKTGALLGLGRGFNFDEDQAGVKVRLFGDAIYDQDSFLPQISVGTQFKTTNHSNILTAVGAKDHAGADFYIAASKLFLDQSLLANVTLRLTKANQLGILGFGGPRNNSYQPEVEASLAYLISRRFVIGAEYRTKPDNLKFTHEDDWKSIYGAYFFNKNVSLTVAYLNFGTIATFKNQQGGYASVQVGF